MGTIGTVPWWFAAGFTIGGALMSAFAPSVLPERMQVFGFWLGLILFCIGGSALIAKLPITQRAFAVVPPKMLIIFFGGGLLVSVCLSWFSRPLSEAIYQAGPFSWRFDAPVTVFMYDRKLGSPVQIDAIQVHGTNNTDTPLRDTEAELVFDRTGKSVRMRINPHGIRPPNPDTSLVPPRATFDITYGLPSKYKEGKHGITADEFLAEYGGFTFIFKYDGEEFSRYFPLSYLENQISFIEEKTRGQAH